MKKKNIQLVIEPEGGESEMNSNFTQSKFIRVNKIADNINEIVQRRISPSETMSLYPDLSDHISRKMGGLKEITATESIALILTFPRNSILYSTLLLELSERALKYQYQGKWIFVQKLCELRFLDLQLYKLLEIGITEETIFGNLIKLGLNRLKRITYFRILYQPKYPKRKRGYNDHGSRREDSRWLPRDVHLGPNPPKRDRSEWIGNIRKTLTNFLYN